MKYAIITFNTIHFAMKAQKALLTKNATFEFVPVPKEISSDCGVCIRIPWTDKDTISQIIKENEVTILDIHAWERQL